MSATGVLSTATSSNEHSPTRARDVAGPWFLNAAWSGWKHSLKELGSGECTEAWLNSTRLFTFDQWQEEIAAHHWMGTWHHNHTVGFNPYFQDWMGVNRSKNCHVGRRPARSRARRKRLPTSSAHHHRRKPPSTSISARRGPA
jgi:hypothetical protein